MSIPEKPIEIFVGNLARYTEGVLDGRWLALPMQQKELDAALNEISKNGRDELILMDRYVRSDCACLGELVGEWSNISDINTVASLIGDGLSPAVEAYAASAGISNLEELANIILQEERIPFYEYSFEGADDPEVMDHLSKEEKMGYTMIEQEEELKRQLDTLTIGGVPLSCYINVEEVGRDLSYNGYFHLYEYGYVNTQEKVPDLSLYKMEEITKSISADKDIGKKIMEIQHHTKPAKPSAPAL